MTTTTFKIIQDKTRENCFKRELQELFDKYGIVVSIDFALGKYDGEYIHHISLYSSKHSDRADGTVVNESIDITIPEGRVDFT